MEALWLIFLLALIFFACVGLFHKHGLEPFGFYKINEFAVEKVRHAVIEACKGASVAGLSREKAQHLLAELARHAVAKTFAEIYTGRAFKVTDNWPGATVIISGNIAVIDLYIGHDYMDDGEGIKPVNVEVSRQPALKLDSRKPIKVALSERYEPPAKQAPAPIAKPAPAAKAVPVRRK